MNRKPAKTEQTSDALLDVAAIEHDMQRWQKREHTLQEKEDEMEVKRRLCQERERVDAMAIVLRCAAHRVWLDDPCAPEREPDQSHEDLQAAATSCLARQGVISPAITRYGKAASRATVNAASHSEHNSKCTTNLSVSQKVKS